MNKPETVSSLSIIQLPFEFLAFYTFQATIETILFFFPNQEKTKTKNILKAVQQFLLLTQ